MLNIESSTIPGLKCYTVSDPDVKTYPAVSSLALTMDRKWLCAGSSIETLTKRAPVTRVAHGNSGDVRYWSFPVMYLAIRTRTIKKCQKRLLVAKWGNVCLPFYRHPDILMSAIFYVLKGTVEKQRSQ